MISYVWCMIFYMMSSLSQPCSNAVQAGSNATQFESNAGPARPLRLSVCPGIKLGLQWFITPSESIRHLPQSTCISPPFSPILIDLFTMLLLARIMPFWLRRECIPLHKLTLDVPWVLCVVHLRQDPDNDLGVRSSKACCASALLRLSQQACCLRTPQE